MALGTVQDNLNGAFVESPTRANKTAVEVTGEIAIDTAGLALESKQDSQISQATSTNTKLDSILTELGQKTEPTDSQNIRSLDFITDQVDVSGSTVELGATSLAALENINVTVTSEVEIKNDSGSPVPISNTNLDATISSRATESTLSSILTELQLKADLTETQPISGTVTANAGVNLNTSALALETTQLTQNSLIGDLTETAPANDTDSSGLNGRLQRIAQRITSLISLFPTSLGKKIASLSFSVTQSEDQTYSAARTNLVVAASATDIFTITGSNTKTIKILKMQLYGSTTSGSPIKTGVQIVKRSTANTGGTSSSVTSVPNNSSYGAGTATVLSYTANPTLGTLLGAVRSSHVAFNQSGITGGEIKFDFKDQPIYLNGASEVLAFNLNATTVTGSLISCYVEWQEI